MGNLAQKFDHNGKCYGLPYDRAQVSAYLAIAALAVLFYGLLAPAVTPRALRITLQAVYAVLQAGTIGFVVAAT